MMERTALGYDSPFVKKLIKGVLTALTTLAVLSFDIKAVLLIKWLKSHLEEKMKESGM